MIVGAIAVALFVFSILEVVLSVSAPAPTPAAQSRRAEDRARRRRLRVPVRLRDGADLPHRLRARVRHQARRRRRERGEGREPRRGRHAHRARAVHLEHQLEATVESSRPSAGIEVHPGKLTEPGSSTRRTPRPKRSSAMRCRASRRTSPRSTSTRPNASASPSSLLNSVRVACRCAHRRSTSCRGNLEPNISPFSTTRHRCGKASPPRQSAAGRLSLHLGFGDGPVE